MGTLQENQSLNAEYERNKKEREMKEEIERLNNIINELEEALKSHKEIKVKAHYGEYYVEIEDIYNYLQKLKGSDKE